MSSSSTQRFANVFAGRKDLGQASFGGSGDRTTELSSKTKTMRRENMRYVYIVILLMLITVHCHANDGSVEGVGGSVALLRSEHGSIRMISEKVEAKLTRDNGAKVRCTFIFKNEGKATTVMMGFPERAEGEEPKQTIKAFKSWVNGKRVKTRLIQGKAGWVGEYKGWHVKDVPFKAGETLTIVDTYTGGIGGNIDGWKWFEYILKTGASWKGRISRADISVDVSALLRARKITSISPKGYTRSGGVVKWALRNIEPKKDINILMVPTVIVDFYMGAQDENHCAPEDRINGTYMVEAVHLLGYVDSMVEQSGKCLMKENGHTLVLTPGSKTAVLDGKKRIKLPQAPYMGPYNRLVVPIAAVVRALGGTASLDRIDGNDRLSIKNMSPALQ